MSNFAASDAMLEVRTRHHWLAFLLAFCSPRIQIDGGEPQKRRWGAHRFTLNPGQHQVRTWFRYIFFAHAGSGETWVDLPAGHVLYLEYKAPTWYVGAKGKFRILGAEPVGGASEAVVAPQVASAAPAGWGPDPTNRHEQRYWDGQGWTAHVSDGGVTSSDPI